jgi:hypothetical protein
MDVHQFGLHSGHLKIEADKIVGQFGAWVVRITEHGKKEGWFEIRSMGHPDDSHRAREVLDAIEEAGGIDDLRRSHYVFGVKKY